MENWRSSSSSKCDSTHTHIYIALHAHIKLVNTRHCRRLTLTLHTPLHRCGIITMFHFVTWLHCSFSTTALPVSPLTDLLDVSSVQLTVAFPIFILFQGGSGTDSGNGSDPTSTVHVFKLPYRSVLGCHRYCWATDYRLVGMLVLVLVLTVPMYKYWYVYVHMYVCTVYVRK